MMQVPTTVSRTIANAEAQPPASRPKQLADERVRMAKHPPSSAETRRFSQEKSALLATASRVTGSVSQQSASRCVAKHRVAKTPSPTSENTRCPMCTASDQLCIAHTA